jgi:hypothetical protein
MLIQAAHTIEISGHGDALRSKDTLIGVNKENRGTRRLRETEAAHL